MFVEYVPVSALSLALNDVGRAALAKRVTALRGTEEMVLVSFPGDEAESGGCLAAGRGFFHISANGSAEPCPFSPYSDTNLNTTPLRQALQSPLFTRLRQEGALDAPHTGGCALFGQAKHIEALASGKE